MSGTHVQRLRARDATEGASAAFSLPDLQPTLRPHPSQRPEEEEGILRHAARHREAEIYAPERQTGVNTP